MTPRRLDALYAALLVVLLAVGALAPGEAPADAAAPPRWVLPYDDPYIHLRYAQAFAQLQPWQWSAGVPSTGATSPVYALLLAPVAWATSAVPALSWAARVLGLAALAWAAWEAAGWARARQLGGAWALAAAAVTVFGSGLGFSALAGMDTAVAAGLLLRWARLDRAERPLAALAPLVRPDLALLTLISAGRAARARQWSGLGVLVPGAAWAAWCRATTGEWLPAGAITKAVPNLPYLTAEGLAREWAARLSDQLGPAYLGADPMVLAPPLGVLACLAAAWALRDAGLRPLALAWLALAALAPFSSHLTWQLARHHQPGFAAAGLLAVLAVGALVRPFRAGPVLALVGAAALAGTQTPRWRAFHRSAADTFWASHGAVADWLDANRAQAVSLATHEAGLWSLYGLGPSVDLLGLGSPAFTRPALHREGAVLEALARRPEPLTLLAVDPHVVDLGPLLEAELVTPTPTMVFARLDRALLLRVDDHAELDFAWLADEAAHRMVWDPPPLPSRAALALFAEGGDGEPSYQGCRPVRGRLGVELGPGDWVLRWSMLPGRSGQLRLAEGDAAGPGRTLHESDETWTTRWNHTRVTLGSAWLWIENTGGPVCVESLRKG